MHERSAVIVFRFLDEQDRILLRQARQQMLRPLENEIPAQMAENDERSHEMAPSTPARAGGRLME
jgi:hypothetical protein